MYTADFISSKYRTASLYSCVREGHPTLFLLVFLGVEKCIKRRKCLEKQEKLIKVGKFISFSRKISVNFSFFLKFSTFSCFSSRFLAFLQPRNVSKKRLGCPSCVRYLTLCDSYFNLSFGTCAILSLSLFQYMILVFSFSVMYTSAATRTLLLI